MKCLGQCYTDLLESMFGFKCNICQKTRTKQRCYVCCLYTCPGCLIGCNYRPNCSVLFCSLDQCITEHKKYCIHKYDFVPITFSNLPSISVILKSKDNAKSSSKSIKDNDSENKKSYFIQDSTIDEAEYNTNIMNRITEETTLETELAASLNSIISNNDANDANGKNDIMSVKSL